MRAKSGPEKMVKGVKKMNTKKLLLSVLFIVATTFALSAGLTAANAGEQPALSARLNLGKDIAIKIETNLGTDVTAATANFAWAGSLGEYDDEVIGEKGTDGEYLFTYRGLSAQHMDKTVNVTVNYSVAGIEQTPVSGTFCVKDYLNALKEKTFKDEGYTEYSLAKLKTLANDTLLYGGAAQKYLAETVENTVGDGVYGSEIYFEDLTPVSSAIQGDSSLAWKTGLRFDCNAQPFGSFALNFDYNEVKVEIYADNEKKAEVVPKTQKGRLIALYEDFSVLDYDKEYTFKVIVDGNEKGSLTYSLATLVLSKQSATDASAKLIKSFYSYCDSACEYASSADFTDHVLIEAEAGTVSNKSRVATGGAVGGYMSGNSFCRNFIAGETLSFNYFAEYDYTSAEIYMIGSSGCVAEYDSGKPKKTKVMKANELFTLSVNSEEKTISDNAVFEGKSATAGDYALFGNRTAVKLCKTTLKRGANQVLFTFKDSPYKNQDNSTASANYDTLMIVLNGKEELPVETVTVGEKIEMENLSFIHGTDAERAGNHPGYSPSGVSGAFSNSAFVKDVRKGGVLSFVFTVEKDCTLSLVLCATSTSSATVDLSNIFNICLNGETLTYSDSTIAAKPSDSWTPSETTLVEGIKLKAGETYVLTFESIITAEQDGSVFYDYIKFAA